MTIARAQTLDLRRRQSSRMRSRAKSFYLAAFFLPGALRRDVQCIYAFYRMADDLVDDPPDGWSKQDILSTLDSWQNELERHASGREGQLGEIVSVMDRYGIPTRALTMMLDGARLDLDLRRMETLEDLHHYSMLVAGSVGMVMAHILGATSDGALSAARDLGVAMQLTNVLRDVDEDFQRGRVYLPCAELERAGYSMKDLEARVVTDAFRQVMHTVIDDARVYYARGTAGIRFLHPSVQFSIYLAADLYERILDKVERTGCNVFSGRAHLGRREKWLVAARTYRKYREGRR